MVAVAEQVGDPVYPAKVTIEAKRQTGTYVNELPRIEFDLLVEPEGMPAYRVTKKAAVPYTALADIAIGSGFRARVMQGHEQRISIDWDSPVGRGSS